MSHEVRSDRDMLYADYEKPWHGIGIPIKGLFAVDDILEKTDLDFLVVKKPLYRQIIEASQDSNEINAKYEKVPGVYETVRGDTGMHLGTVGLEYQPYQNVDFFNYLAGLTEQKSIFDTAGTLFGGKKVWALLRVKGKIDIGGIDPINKFLVAVLHHHSPAIIMFKYTPIRVVCWNTLSAAVGNWAKDSTVLKIRQSANTQARLDEVAEILGYANQYYDRVSQIYGEMANFPMRPKLLEKYYRAVVPDPVAKIKKIDEDGFLYEEEEELNPVHAERVREQLVDMFETSPSINDLKTSRGTLWGAFNAVTQYVQYNHGRLEGERRFNAVCIDNSGYRYMRQKSLDVATKLLKVKGVGN